MFKILRALSGHSQNRSLDEEALASRKNYLFDQVRSPYSVLVNTSALVPFFFVFLLKFKRLNFRSKNWCSFIIKKDRAIFISLLLIY